MLNPFSISLAVQPLKIYRGLCLNEGSSLTHRAPLILGEKTNSRPADTRLTVLFPSPGDTQPLPRCHSSPPLQPQQLHLCSPTSAVPHLQPQLCSPSKTWGPPWLWGCPSAKHPLLGCPLLPMAVLAAQHPWDAPVGGGCPAATLPCLHWDGAGNRSKQCCKWLCAGAAHSQALITAAGTSLARLDAGVRPGSQGQLRSRDSADVF